MYLIDRLKEHKNIEEPDGKALKNCISIDAQDVWHYLMESEKPTLDPVTDFPCVRPPYPLLWVEFKERESRHGYIIVESGNMVAVKPWRIDGDNVSELMCLFRYRYNEKGELETELMPNGQRTGIEVCGLSPEANKILESDDNAQKMIQTLSIPMLTLSFLSCKNIEAVVSRESPGKLNLKRQKSGKPPLTKIYTLKIDGIKRIFQKATPSGMVSKQALHLCRGHFKDFSHGRGLFGRYQGRYWWGHQARGSKEYGERIKNYAVKAQ